MIELAVVVALSLFGYGYYRPSSVVGKKFTFAILGRFGLESKESKAKRLTAAAREELSGRVELAGRQVAKHKLRVAKATQLEGELARLRARLETHKKAGDRENGQKTFDYMKTKQAELERVQAEIDELQPTVDSFPALLAQAKSTIDQVSNAVERNAMLRSLEQFKAEAQADAAAIRGEGASTAIGELTGLAGELEEDTVAIRETAELRRTVYGGGASDIEAEMRQEDAAADFDAFWKDGPSDGKAKPIALPAPSEPTPLDRLVNGTGEVVDAEVVPARRNS